MSSPPALELWGGIECTRNRVGDRTFDQLDRSGHSDRLSDLDLVAGTGVTAVRYPVLWERVAPHGLRDADWTWADERLERLRELGVEPIVGLLHHGSGPADTSLRDPAFPMRFAEYAAAFAERYPWVDAYAPINEPMTTARFSGLYGHWHPHDRDEASMMHILVQQCVAVSRAMQAIRMVNPDARLVLNDDVTTVHSTEAMAAEAAFQNERRWLSFDLLCGTFDEHHPLWGRLAHPDRDGRALRELLESPCPPDVIGVDYYATSERFLDERVERYPDREPGANDSQTFVDVEAIRVCERIAGWDGTLRQVWDRYGLPIAITEAHQVGHREDQIRWLRDVWEAAERSRRDGVDVRAVTVWSMFGAFDWNALVTVEGTFYEPGAFDVRSGKPRPTAVATQMRALAGIGDPPPVADGPGWWERDDRFLYPPVAPSSSVAGLPAAERRPDLGAAAPPLLVVGDGALAAEFLDASRRRGLACVAERNLGSGLDCDAALARHRPWAVVLAGHGNDPLLTAMVAERCERAGVHLATFSSAQVFGAHSVLPCDETAPVRPAGPAGRVAAEMERRVAVTAPSSLVIRPGTMLPAGLAASPLDPDDPRATRPRSWTSPQAMVDATLDLLIDGESGVWHLAHRGVLSWNELVAEAALLGIAIDGQPDRAARRETPVALATIHGWHLPSIDETLAALADQPTARQSATV